MICFIILHYMVFEETEECVRSLEKVKGDKSIVIVDNASPNESGQRLFELYKDREDITVAINKKNFGFAKGNNLGCQIAKDKYDPDYYVVMNNDIELLQADFIEKVESIFEEEHFDILGPDIYSTTERIHQSPKSLKRTSVEESRRLLNYYYKRNKSKIVVPLRCYLKRIKLLKRTIKSLNNRAIGIDYGKKYCDVPLHGSCLIFSRKYIEKRDNPFFAGTFFYYESEILDYESQIDGYKVVYDPLIKVLHHQNISTNTVYTSELKKVRFMNEQNFKSISAFLEEYDDKQQ